jgi:hypothetical protein
MPTVPAMPPADRCFARLERFQCACPSCGRLMTSHQDQGHLSKRLLADGYKPTSQKYRRRARTITATRQLTWNPYTQRLTCPWCRNSFVAGLVLFPAMGGPCNEAPPDTVPTRAERMQLRAIAGGWCTEEGYHNGDPVNQYVPGGCSCPLTGWSAECRLHGKRARPPAAAEPGL